MYTTIITGGAEIVEQKHSKFISSHGTPKLQLFTEQTAMRTT